MEVEDNEPKRRSLIPPPPSHPPPPRPAKPPVVESVDAGEEQSTGEEDGELEIGDITLTEKTDEEQQEEGAESEGDREYSYVRSESKERLDEASPSPENLGDEEDRPTSVMSAPDYENVTEDMLSQLDEEDMEIVKTYMNVRRSQVGEDEDDAKRNSRPGSYLNMAPFPPDFKPPSPDPDGNDATDSLPSTGPKPAPRKPKNRVPPPPPPNYKDILRQLSGSPSSDVIPRPAVISARTHGMDSSRPILNKLTSSPATSTSSPAAPAKPPRARQGRTPSDSSDKERGRTPIESDQSSSPRPERRAASPDSIQRSPHRALVKSQSSDVLSPRKQQTPELSKRHLAARRAPLAPGNTSPQHPQVKKPVAARIVRSKMVTKDQPAISAAKTDKSPAGSPRQRAPVRSAPPPPQAGAKKTADPSPVAARRRKAGEEASPADSTARSSSPLLIKQSSEKKSEDEPVITEKVARALEAMKSRAESVQSGLKQGQVLPIDGRVASPDTQASLTREFSSNVLSRMTIFNVELQRVEGQSLGLHIAEGVAGTNKGHDMKGVFVKDIITGTPASSSKKICVQDVLVEIAGVSVLGSSLEDAARLLKGAGDTVRLKVGRTTDQAKTTSAAALPPSSAPSSRMADDSELKEENKKLQEELSKLKQELLESEDNANDLTQTVASVSVEKTKLEREAHKLRDQLSKLSSQSSDTEELATVRTKLKQAQNDKESLEQDLESARTELKSLNSDHTSLRSDHKSLQSDLKSLQSEHKSLQNDHKSLQSDHASAKTTIKQLTEKNNSLTAEVEELKEQLKKERELRESAENRLTDTPHKEPEQQTKALRTESEQHTKAAPPEAPPKPSLTATPRKDRSVSPSPSPTCDEPEEEPVEEAETSSSEKEEESKDVEDAPEEPVSDEVKEEEEEEVVKVSIAVDEVEKEEEEEDTLSLDEVKSASRLDSSSALHKSHLTAQMRRKKPTREHVRSMATLSPFPEEMPRLSLEMEDEESRTAGAGGSVHTPKKPMKLPQPTPPKPKPRPQPMPRKKPSPEHTTSPNPTSEKSDDQKRPMPVPRTQREANDKEEVDGGTLDSPVAAKKLASSSPAGSPKHSKHSSPAHSPKLPIKPPVATPEPTERRPTGGSKPVVPRKPPAKEESPEDDKESRRPSGSTPKKLPKPLPPKPSPRPQKPDGHTTQDLSSAGGEKEAAPPSTMADKLEAIKKKDPSELTVKEKMMLAQQAMALQAEYKQKGLPPPIRKKRPLPKAVSVDSHEAEHHDEPAEEKTETSEEMDRSQSSDNIADTDGAPPRRPPKKLPPGAFNMAFNMAGLGGDPRRRSNTVASTGSSDGADTLERQSPARHFSASKPETSNSPTPTPESTPVRQPVVNNSPAHQIQEEDASQLSNHSTPELNRKDASHHGSTDMLESYADMDIDDEPPIPTSTDGETQAGGAVPDKEQVLFWSPEVVGMWLGSLGLGSHANSFKEKEVKGWMLFDIDNSKLKKLGVSSGDDRNIFKKELKALKPFADKIKRDYDRKKREDKKRLEQEKKLAKKKK